MSRLTLAQEMRERLGVTICVWFPTSMSPESMQAQVARTLDDSELFTRPENVVVVVDGCPQAIEPVRGAAESFRARCGEAPVVIEKELNEGQGGAVACGIEFLLAERDVACIACRDGDGDHDVYDLPPMYRLLRAMTSPPGGAATSPPQPPSPRTCGPLGRGGSKGNLTPRPCPAGEGELTAAGNAYVVGCRSSLHRPMGFARGEFEHILNRITMTAVNAHLAPQGWAVDEGYSSLQGDVADFQSGYKLYTRRTAETAARALRGAAAAKPEVDPALGSAIRLDGGTAAVRCRRGGHPPADL